MSTEVRLPFSRTPDPFPLALRGNGVLVVCGRAGPTGVPEHAHPELHVIVLFRSSSFQAKWKTGTGYRERELLPGQVCIIPSNQPHSVHWEREIDVGVFTLDPAFVLKAAGNTMARDALPTNPDVKCDKQLPYNFMEQMPKLVPNEPHG